MFSTIAVDSAPLAKTPDDTVGALIGVGECAARSLELCLSMIVCIDKY